MIGLFIHKPLFSHGKLYVALSRRKSPSGIKIQKKKNLMTVTSWHRSFLVDEPINETFK